jgi:hypothetical protein
MGTKEVVLMRRATLVLCSLFLVSGCALLKGLTNRKVLGAAVLFTPEVAPTQVPGYPQGFPAIAGQVTAQLFFGERQDDITSGGTNTSPPLGIDGAVVTLGYHDASGAAHLITLKQPAGGRAGQYQATAADGLTYVPNATYQFKVESGGEEFTASVSAPPAPKVNEFPAAGYEVVDGYAAFDHETLTFGRSGEDLAFYGAWRVNTAAPQSTFDDPTCTNLPVSASMDPAQLVDLILDPTPWEKSTYTLDKTSTLAGQSCFPQGPTSGPVAYALGLGLGRRGTFSDNLFVGSVVFAGALDGSALVFAR